MKRDLSSPPVTEVTWLVKRRDGRPLFREIITNGVSTTISVKQKRYRGRTARQVYDEHLAKIQPRAGFSEFVFEVLEGSGE